MPRKSQFTEQQIIRALQEVDAGATAADVCRRLGVAEATFYRWKSKYGGMDVSDAKRLKELETENARLNKPWTLRRSGRCFEKNGEAHGPSPGRGLY